jgi:pyridinium-3,5-bisthiocarboxylic acid mononucleotide nickel chelatase
VIAFVDARRGISGTSLLAALIDAGADPDAVADRIGSFRSGVKLRAEEVVFDGLRSRRIVVDDADVRVTDGPRDLVRMLSASGLPREVVERATDVYRRLAAAEARVHGVETDSVRFEELATVRSVIGVLGSLLALGELGVDSVTSTPLPFGGGVVETHHGRLPLPAPATLELLRGIPVEPQEGPGELVTPTGAALLAVLASSFDGIRPGTIEAIGIGSSGDARSPIVTRLVLASP